MMTENPNKQNVDPTNNCYGKPSSSSKHSSKWAPVKLKLIAFNTFNNSKKQKESKSKNTDLPLPLGVTVTEDRDANGNGTINVVDLNFKILLNTHTTETTVNEKGSILTFLYKKYMKIINN